jgi:hypothetical protein
LANALAWLESGAINTIFAAWRAVRRTASTQSLILTLQAPLPEDDINNHKFSNRQKSGNFRIRS